MTNQRARAIIPIVAIPKKTPSKFIQLCVVVLLIGLKPIVQL